MLKFQRIDYDINDIFHLKMEIEAYPHINDENIFLECELCHCQLNVGEKEKNNNEVV